jgi:hypothetical protein
VRLRTQLGRQLAPARCPMTKPITRDPIYRWRRFVKPGPGRLSTGGLVDGICHVLQPQGSGNRPANFALWMRRTMAGRVNDYASTCIAMQVLISFQP